MLALGRSEEANASHDPSRSRHGISFAIATAPMESLRAMGIRDRPISARSLGKMACGKGHRIHRRDCLAHVVISVSSKFPTRTGQSAALFQPLLGVLLVTATHELCPYYKRCWPTALVGSRGRPITARPRRTRAASIVNRARASKATQQLQLGSVARWDWGGQMVLRASRAGTDQLGAGFFHPCVVRTVGPTVRLSGGRSRPK